MEPAAPSAVTELAPDFLTRAATALRGASADLAADNAAAKAEQDKRDMEALKDLVARRGETTIALWLHQIIHATPTNLRCKHKCRDGRVSVGTITVTAHHYKPCPDCNPGGHAAHVANDPMVADERQHYANGGKNWAGD